LNTNFCTLSICERKNRLEIALARAMATHNDTEIRDEIIYYDLLFIYDKSFTAHSRVLILSRQNKMPRVI
jgi:hypothetical protein